MCFLNISFHQNINAQSVEASVSFEALKEKLSLRLRCCLSSEQYRLKINRAKSSERRDRKIESKRLQEIQLDIEHKGSIEKEVLSFLKKTLRSEGVRLGYLISKLNFIPVPYFDDEQLANPLGNDLILAHEEIYRLNNHTQGIQSRLAEIRSEIVKLRNEQKLINNLAAKKSNKSSDLGFLYKLMALATAGAIVFLFFVAIYFFMLFTGVWKGIRLKHRLALWRKNRNRSNGKRYKLETEYRKIIAEVTDDILIYYNANLQKKLLDYLNTELLKHQPNVDVCVSMMEVLGESEASSLYRRLEDPQKRIIDDHFKSREKRDKNWLSLIEASNHLKQILGLAN